MENLELWDKVQLILNKVIEERMMEERNRDFRTMLDIYGLYIASRLKKDRIESEIIRAAQRGKSHCKLLKLENRIIQLTDDQLVLLVDYTSKSVQNLLKENRFKVCCTKEFVFYLSWDIKSS